MNNSGQAQQSAGREDAIAEALTEMIAAVQNRLLEFNEAITPEMEWVHKEAYKTDMEWVLESIGRIRDHINNT